MEPTLAELYELVLKDRFDDEPIRDDYEEAEYKLLKKMILEMGYDKVLQVLEAIYQDTLLDG